MSENGNPTKIDAIKELIFGQNIKENEARFASIEKAIANNKTSAKSFSEVQHQKLLDALTAHQKAYEKTINTLEKQIEALKQNKVDRTQLKTLLVVLAEKL